MNELLQREMTTEMEWESPEQAKETLDKFCIFLNYYFQGEECEMELSEIW